MTVSIELPERTPLPRIVVLAFMAQLCVVAKQIRAAEGYLLELIAICAFGERTEGAIRWD